ncbi:coil containing protein [Vibrio phage 2.275.O._10N.286.54.E11]|nr:coil containing protein [Vibrio phage 2.275.O._10N.286.54.E11]
MKKIAFIALMTIGVIPNTYADTIRTSDGISCSFDADDSPYEVESYIEQGDFNSNSNYNDMYTDSIQDDQRVGVKLTVKFGGPKRLNCDKLYQLELRSKSAKVAELEAKVKALEAAQDIKW